MNFELASFITSAPSLKECPDESLPEFCFAGRSNVGKSSLINKITNKKKLAKTSNTPGKTQLINYYKIDDTIYLVDLPGFGFAKVSERERQRWGKDIQTYLRNRSTLELILHLVDSRHKPTALDEDFFYWMASNQMPFVVLMTKSDKLTKNKLARSEKVVRNVLADMNIEVPIISCSADTGKGIDEIKSILQEYQNAH